MKLKPSSSGLFFFFFLGVEWMEGGEQAQISHLSLTVRCADADEMNHVLNYYNRKQINDVFVFFCTDSSCKDRYFLFDHSIIIQPLS